MGGSKKQTVGYKYFMGLHFGLCHGPVDALLEVRGGDRTGWIGSVTESSRITIDAPDLWGGEKKEGGIVGDLDVMMGEPDQAANDYLESQLGTPMPAFRGILSLVFRKGMVGAMNPYPKPWKFKVRRILKGWAGETAWYPEKAGVLVGARPPVQMFAFDAVWKYKVEPPSSGADYSAPSYDDSDWETGPGGFGNYPPGWDTPPANTIIPYQPYEHVWIRRTFGPIPNGHELIIDVWHDNAGRLWLNGEEVPLTVVVPPYLSQARIPARGLQGVNTVAVKVSDLGPAYIYAAMEMSHHLPGVLGMNPAHIVYEALTNPDWGLGYPPAVLDLASFTAAADLFSGEGMGLCGQWTRQDSVEGFIQEVMDHAGAVLAQDPRTGLFRILPIRGNYTPGLLPEFRRGLNVLAVQSFETAAITEAVNEITVHYKDATTGKDGSVTVQHLANVQAQGGVAPQTVRYPMAPTMGLAQRLALRDLAAKAIPLCKARLSVDRSAYGILPGEVVRWSDAKLGIIDMPMRVLKVDYGSLTAGAITLDLAEDVFGLPATTYMGQQEGGWQEPDNRPKPSPQAEPFEVPYVLIHRREGAGAVAQVDPASGFIGMVAARAPGVSYGYTLHARTDGGEFEEIGVGEWAAGGLLADAVGAGDTVLQLAAVHALNLFTPGELAMLGTGPAAELLRIDAVDPVALTVTVGRGVGDTVASAWPIGTRLWGVEDGLAVGVTEYVDGENVEARADTNAGGGSLTPGSGPGGVVTIASRVARPYPPGAFRINGEADPSSLYGELVVTWAHRDRIAQGDQLVDQEAASVGPEPGVTYTLRTYLDDVLVDEQAGITGTTASVLPGADGMARVELESVRDGLTSWHAQVREFAYVSAPSDTRVTVGGDTRVTVGGGTRVTRG